MKTLEQVQGEKLEILAFSLARYLARPNPGLWAEDVRRVERSIERTRAGEFFNPYGLRGSFQDQDAHEAALSIARTSKAMQGAA